MPDRRALLVEVLVAGSFSALCLMTAAPAVALAGIGANIGINLLSNLAKFGCDHWTEKWFSGEMTLNHDLARAFTKSLTAAVQQIMSEVKSHPRIPRIDKEAARLFLQNLADIGENADKVLVTITRSIELEGRDELIALVQHGDKSALATSFKNLVDRLFPGYDPELVGFVQERLAEEWLKQFNEIIKTNDKQGIAAWNAYQLQWQASLTDAAAQLQTTLEATGKDIEDIHDLLSEVQATIRRLETAAPTERDITNLSALGTALPAIVDKLSQLDRKVDLLLAGHNRPALRTIFKPLIDNYTQIFAGRDATLAEIRELTHRREGGYLAITAPAGFGKTALMANLAAQGDFAYHFFDPIHVNDGLSEDFFLRNVLQQMTAWRRPQQQLWMQVDSARSIQDLSALYRQWLSLEPNRPQTILLDGLDEVQTWRLMPYLSLRLPKHLNIVVTIRDVGQDWAKEYAFPKDQLTHLPLVGLSQQQVAQVLNAAGGHATALADDTGVLNQIMQVALYEENTALGADPLYVRVLAEDARDGLITASNVASQPRGLAAYLERWLNQLELSVESEPGRAEAIRDLIFTLVVALGPISRADLEALHPSLRKSHGILRPFPSIVALVRRFVSGDDTRGYVLMHARLRYYMRNHPDVDASAYHEQLLAYCSQWQDHASIYALTYYARHLAEADKFDELYQLINRPWLELKLHRTYSHLSFAEDVHLAIQVAQEETPINWVQLIRGSLLSATLGSLATNVPPELLSLMVLHGQVERAQGYAALMHDPWPRSRAYIEIATTLSKQGDTAHARICLQQALAAAGSILNEDVHAQEFHRIVQALAAAGEFEQALAVAGSIQSESKQVFALREIAQALAAVGEKERALAVVEQALVVAGSIQKEQEQVFALRSIAEALAGADEFEQALAVAKSIQEEQEQAWALCSIVRELAAANEFEEALSVARSIQSERHQTSALTEIAQALAATDEKERALAVVAEALVVARIIQPELFQASALCSIAKTLAAVREFEQALAVARSIRSERDQTSALTEIARALAATDEKVRVLAVVEQALTVAGSIHDKSKQVAAHLSFVQALAAVGEKERALAVVEQALAVARSLEKAWQKAFSLRSIAEALVAAGEFEQALAVAKSIQSEQEQAWALSSIAKTLAAADEFEQALAVARSIRSERDQTSALTEIARALAATDEKERVLAVVEQALTVAGSIQSESKQVFALREIAQALAAVGEKERALAVVEQALVVAGSIQKEQEQVFALRSIAEALAGADEFEQALAVAKSIQEEQEQAWALCSIVRELAAANEFEEALSVARSIQSERDQTSALTEIAQALASVGDKERGLAVVEQALAVVRSTQGEWNQVFALTEIAQALVATDEKERALAVVEQALTVAGSIQSEWHQVFALTEIAQTLAATDEKERALAVVEQALAVGGSIQSESKQVFALTVIARALAATDEKERALAVVEQALAVAGSIQKEQEQVFALRSIAEALAAAGEFEQALAVARSIHGEGYQALALISIALAKLAKEQWNTAVLQLVAEAFIIVQRLERKDLWGILDESIPLLAAIDQGKTLWQVYQAIIEIESWWAPPPPPPLSQ